MGSIVSIVSGEPVLAVGGDGERLGDLQEHAIGICQHVIVPEADHGVAEQFDLAGSLDVSCIVGVLATIEFNRQFRPATSKIHDGIADCELPCELSAKLLAAQPRLQAHLRVGRFAAQSLRQRCQSFSGHSPNTPTQPSPSRGRTYSANSRDHFSITFCHRSSSLTRRFEANLDTAAIRSSGMSASTRSSFSSKRNFIDLTSWQTSHPILAKAA